MMKD
jgi:hypothetical protein